MTLELTDEEAAALLRELNTIIENDRYPLSPRIRTLRDIRAKLPGAPGSTACEPAAHRPASAIGMSEVVPLRRIIILACCLALAPIAASAGGHRSREVTREFQRLHPCPSTGRTSGACPGYVKDSSCSTAAAPMPSSICNGRRQKRRRPRTAASGKSRGR
jgi:hypothetical protein